MWGLWGGSVCRPAEGSAWAQESWRSGGRLVADNLKEEVESLRRVLNVITEVQAILGPGGSGCCGG